MIAHFAERSVPALATTRQRFGHGLHSALSKAPLLPLRDLCSANPESFRASRAFFLSPKTREAASGVKRLPRTVSTFYF